MSPDGIFECLVPADANTLTAPVHPFLLCIDANPAASPDGVERTRKRRRDEQSRRRFEIR